MIELTPKLIYEDLYASAYKDLLKYSLSEAPISLSHLLCNASFLLHFQHERLKCK